MYLDLCLWIQHTRRLLIAVSNVPWTTTIYGTFAKMLGTCISQDFRFRSTCRSITNFEIPVLVTMESRLWPRIWTLLEHLRWLKSLERYVSVVIVVRVLFYLLRGSSACGFMKLNVFCTCSQKPDLVCLFFRVHCLQRCTNTIRYKPGKILRITTGTYFKYLSYVLC